MNTTTFNRTVLATVIGSVLALGMGAPSTAHAQRHDRVSQDQADAKTDEDAKAERKRVRDQEKVDRAAAETVRQQGEQSRIDAREGVQRERGQQQAELRQRQGDQRQAQQDNRDAQAQREQRRLDAQQADPRNRGQATSEMRQQQNAERQAQQARDVQAAQVLREQRQDAQQAQMAARNRGQATSELRQQQNAERQAAQQSQRPGNTIARRPAREQQLLINQQRQQVATYSRGFESRQATARQRTAQLQQQNRTSQYRYQQQYYDRMRQQQSRNNWQSYNYSSDPYFYTMSSYRYQRGGNYYTTNRYGADLLQQAINYGYSEGLRAGRADRDDRWRYNYRDSYAYQDANYGYNGYYVGQGEYNYYFRQGFQRGYEDGYYSRRRFGRTYNGNDILLGTVLSIVLNLQPYHR